MYRKLILFGTSGKVPPALKKIVDTEIALGYYKQAVDETGL